MHPSIPSHVPVSQAPLSQARLTPCTPPQRGTTHSGAWILNKVGVQGTDAQSPPEPKDSRGSMNLDCAFNQMHLKGARGWEQPQVHGVHPMCQELQMRNFTDFSGHNRQVLLLPLLDEETEPEGS